MTNGDKIRAMSNNELVDFIQDTTGMDCDYCPAGGMKSDRCRNYGVGESCSQKIMRWLERGEVNE